MSSQPGALPVLGESCCGGSRPEAHSEVHSDLAALLSQYDINAYAASVKIYAVKQA